MRNRKVSHLFLLNSHIFEVGLLDI
jgi:hypothetical protein